MYQTKLPNLLIEVVKYPINNGKKRTVFLDWWNGNLISKWYQTQFVNLLFGMVKSPINNGKKKLSSMIYNKINNVQMYSSLVEWLWRMTLTL